MKWYYVVFFVLILAFWIGRGGQNVDYASLRSRADKPLDELLGLLRSIATGKELRQRAGAIERVFQDINAAMRQAQQQITTAPHKNNPPPISAAAQRRNAALNAELQRVSTLLGGRALLREMQQRVLQQR